MQKIKITNVIGENIEIGAKAPFLLQSLDGVGNVSINIESQKAPNQDGVTYLDNNLEPRPITIEGMILADNTIAVQQKRRLMQKVFNPKIGEGTLLFDYNGVEKIIRFIVEETPIFPSGDQNAGENYQKFLVNIICNNPFWLDTFTESEPLGESIGGLSFPLVLPSTFGLREFQKTLINQGDVPTPVLIEIIAGDGDGGNPEITNETTGELLKVNQPLDLNDVLRISTEFGNKFVTLNGENAFNYIDLESEFWQLAVGENIIKYSSDAESIATKITITWRNRYIGV